MLTKLLCATVLVGASAVFLENPVVAEREATGAYRVDAVHSSVLFRIRHLDTAYFFGRFNEIEGTLTVAEDPARSSLELTIPAASVDTNNKNRDEHLKGPDFLDVRQYPEIEFRSTDVEQEEPGVLSVTGDFTLHGVTREITVTATHTGHGEVSERFGYRTGYLAEFTLQRGDFGVSALPEGLGNEVKVILSLEAVKF